LRCTRAGESATSLSSYRVAIRPSEWSATAAGTQREYGWHHQARQIAKKAELARIERRLEAAQERRDDATTPFTGRKKPARAADPAGPVARWPAPGTDISDRRRHREDDVEVIIRHRQQLGLSVGQPLSNAPTLGTSG
jgi:hypothetical protein